MRRILISFFATVLTVSVLAGIGWLVINQKTQYAPGYSKAKFKMVRVGMSSEEVIALLGTPYRTSTQRWSEIWRYFPPAKDQPPIDSVEFRQRIVPYTYTYLSFSPSGTVASFGGEYLGGELVGLTKTQILARFNQPNESISNEYVLVFHYSGSRNSSHYLFRNVYLDASNRVTQTEAGFYYD